MRRVVAAVVTAVFLAACGGGQKTKDAPVTGDDPVSSGVPDAATIAEHPCGKPDWSELPEGSEEEQPPQ